MYYFITFFFSVLKGFFFYHSILIPCEVLRFDESKNQASIMKQLQSLIKVVNILCFYDNTSIVMRLTLQLICYRVDFMVKRQLVPANINGCSSVDTKTKILHSLSRSWAMSHGAAETTCWHFLVSSRLHLVLYSICGESAALITTSYFILCSISKQNVLMWNEGAVLI